METSKLDKLCELINEEQPYLAMAFCSTRTRVSQVAITLAKRGYRSALVGSYVLLYRFEGDTVYIAHIFHQRQDYATLV